MDEVSGAKCACVADRSYHPSFATAVAVEQLEMMEMSEGITEKLQHLGELQAEVNKSVQDFKIAEVLLDPLFSDELLPRLWEVLSSEPPESGGLGLIFREVG
eukprot:g18131.t1